MIFTLATGTLLAQPAPSTPPPADSSDAGSDPAVTLTVAEMTEQAGSLVEQAARDNDTVVALQLKARKEKDVIKLNCINDKLLQIKAHANMLERAKSAFDGLSTNEAEQRVQFGEVQTNAGAIRILREQALICAGELDLKSDTQSSWSGPDIPDDPSKELFPDEIEQPGYASPFS
ncbi:MAG: hypothetical protein AB7R00_24655 [Kofleriaceae bacterium]